jgi:hypothetical protein
MILNIDWFFFAEFFWLSQDVFDRPSHDETCGILEFMPFWLQIYGIVLRVLSPDQHLNGWRRFTEQLCDIRRLVHSQMRIVIVIEWTLT